MKKMMLLTTMILLVVTFHGADAKDCYVKELTLAINNSEDYMSMVLAGKRGDIALTNFAHICIEKGTGIVFRQGDRVEVFEELGEGNTQLALIKLNGKVWFMNGRQLKCK